MHSLPLPLAAFFAGVLSFLSPCVLPLVPGYVSLISGASVETLQAADRKLLRTVMLNSLCFILGFSVVFISLGAVATSLGQLTQQYHRPLAIFAGIVIIIFGLHLTGLFKINALYSDKRLHGVKGGASPLGSFLIGFAFAFGWTPCIGPILAESCCSPARRTRSSKESCCSPSTRQDWPYRFFSPRSASIVFSAFMPVFAAICTQSRFSAARCSSSLAC